MMTSYLQVVMRPQCLHTVSRLFGSSVAGMAPGREKEGHEQERHHTDLA